MSHVRASATKQTTLGRCLDVVRKWGTRLLLVALGFALGWF